MMKNEWIVELLKALEKQEFYGKLTLHFNGGNVAKITKEESILKPEETISNFQYDASSSL